MASKSAIEWTDATWTPIRARNKATGKIGWHCEHASPGCVHCYSEGFNERRLGTGLPFKPGHRNDVEHFLDEKMLLAPLRWRRRRMIFVCSMTDLFGAWVPDAWIDRVFAIMALCPQHTFQVLTKRSARMRAYFDARREGDPWAEAADEIADLMGWENHAVVLEPRDLPLPNVWLGVSAEDQQRAEERVPDLVDTPAAVRFVSAEPLLGPIDLTALDINGEGEMDALNPRAWSDEIEAWRATSDEWEEEFRDWYGLAEMPAGGQMSKTLDWVIVGGESGPGARPMHPGWARSIRDQCAAAGVAFFFKQWGEWAPHQPVPGGDLGGDGRAGRVRIVHPSGRSDVEISQALGGRSTEAGSRYMSRLGKARAGRLLDGVTHDAMPEVRP